MKKKGGFDQITQIISLSNNYTRHKKNLKEIKPQLDTSNRKRDQKFYQLLNEKSVHSQLVNREKKKIIAK